MRRHAPTLTSEQADIADLIGAVVAGTTHHPCDEHPETVDVVRRQLAELGVWTLGVSTSDGPGAGDELAAVAFACLGQDWPALAWAAVQAHTALDVLGDSAPAVDIQTGRATVAVVDDASAVVRLTVTDGRISGRVDRIDPAGKQPHILVLRQDSARLIPPHALRLSSLRRTGFDGALTTSAELVEPLREEKVTITGVDTDAARTRLRLGAAAIAAGIAAAAADAALTYTEQREQFGAPLTALPTVREMLLSSSGAATTLFRQVLWPRGCVAWHAAAVLETACELAIETCARAVQVHGGYGYLTDYPAERLLRDAVSLRAACDVAGASRAGAAELVGAGAVGSWKGAS